MIHIVIRDDKILLAKRPGADWRDLQDEFTGFKTSLGPYSLAETLEFIELAWPDIFAARAEDIADFADGPQDLLEL